MNDQEDNKLQDILVIAIFIGVGAIIIILMAAAIGI